MKEGWNLEISGLIARLTINRPQRLNALNTHLLEELDALLSEIERRKETRVLIITGSGEKAFIAGADIDQMSSMEPKNAEYLIKVGHRAFSRLEDLAIPTIAAINGYAIGGGLELALCADFRLCSQNAKLGLPEINLGVIAGWGGPCRLGRLVGGGRAKELFLRGRLINPQEAMTIGLVTEVFPTPEELVRGAQTLADELAARAPITMRLDKKIINDVIVRGHGIEAERDALALAYLFTTADTREGITAFVQKRKPEFKGN